MASPLQCRLLGDADAAVWQALWEASPRWLPQAPEVLKAAAAERLVAAGVSTASGELRAVAAFIEDRRAGLRAWRHAAPAAFGGVLGENSPEVFTALAQWVRSQVARADLILAPGIVDGRPFRWEGWALHPHYNFVSDAGGELEATLSSAARRQLRKAREAGLRIEWTDDVSALHALRESTAERQRIAEQLSWDAYRRLAALSTPHRKRVALVRDAVGALHCGALFLADAQRTYYSLGASDAAHLGSGAPTLLHVEALRQLADEGWPTAYDWCGANTAGVARFKEGFNPRLELLVRAEWTSSAVKVWNAVRKG